ncbi:elongation factor G [Microvirga sp. W0021]|uniref:Elongation factor G n=1 Tax=Hohaiivirga grylli TaxID=3133970 RepID=A0ABV0BN72_9HYPH
MANIEIKNGRVGKGSRCFAIVGPFQSGKTTLLESILLRSGALERVGRVADGSSYGDASAEARAHIMSTEPNVATVSYLGETMTFIDCPGSVEFLRDMRATLPVCDAAIVVCEADERKLPALEVVMKELEEAGIPRILFINKIDAATQRIHDTLSILQPASKTPLLLRQIPIWKDGIAVGYIDLALERAAIYREHAESEVVDIPASDVGREKDARFEMLEKLADYDDKLMEGLISEIEPPRDQVFDEITKDLRAGNLVPVLFGSAERANGVTRLLKTLRHDGPGLAQTLDRLQLEAEGPPLAHVVKTFHTTHGGKISLSRVLRGRFTEGDTVTGSSGGETRIAGLTVMKPGQTQRLAEAVAGDVAAFARLDNIATGESFTTEKTAPEPVISLQAVEPVYAMVIKTKDRKDDVRLTASLAKIAEEDPSYIIETRPDLGEIRLHGQGEMHLRVALEKLASRYQVEVHTSQPKVAYRETIKGQSSARGRHKKQSGGHGQYGDVMIEIAPMPRGEGFVFNDKITGGVVPKQYIPSVETGIKDGLRKGILGFPVVDIAVTLTDGSYHAVDSSDAAFQMAAKIGLQEALPNAQPVLLEPVLAVDIAVPSETIAKASALVSARRGQILGYDARPGWQGWDILQALIPEAEISDMIIELRSATAGVGTFSTKFSHMSELVGKAADVAVAANRGE